MKWLVLLLLLFNAVYLGWEIDRKTRSGMANRSAAVEVPSGTVRLSLIRELPAPPARRRKDALPRQFVDPGPGQTGSEIVSQLPDIAVAEMQTGPVEISCFTFGPLAEETQAVWLGDWFRNRRAEVAVRATTDPDRQLFWVYLAPEGSRASALAILDELQKGGVGDMRLISRGNLQNAISLGLFTSQAAVNSRLSELERKGYHPVVVPYADAQRIFWLDVRVPSTDDTLGSMFSGIPAGYNSVPVKCAEIAIDAASS
ncbi:MAG: hypothetical protein ACREUU_03985 [Gammaproteobacteria bacterium]